VSQHIFGPAEFPGHADIKLSFQVIFTSGHYEKVFGPTDFSNQWLEGFDSRSPPAFFPLLLVNHPPDIPIKQVGYPLDTPIS